MAKESLVEDLDDNPPIAIQDRAMDNLSFIREAMERSTPFTGISGKGLILMGLIALAGGQIARMQTVRDGWIYTWLAVACLGVVTGLVATVLKMRGQDRPSVVRAARRFAFNLAPAILAGVFLTEMFYELGLNAFMPGMWLMLYGTGVVAGGALSVRVLPDMGGLMMALGAATLFWTLWGSQSFAIPDVVGEAAMAVGFGGMHIIAGIIVYRRYGG